MRLRELDGCFLKYCPEDGSYDMKATLAEADGVQFQCPKCAEGLARGQQGERQFVRGAHYIICWFVGKVPDHVTPSPGRWTPQGTSLDDLTFVPGEPARAVSVLLTGPGCGWHGFIVNGETKESPSEDECNALLP